MAQEISIILDDKAMDALDRLEATGMSRSEAIGYALLLANRRLAETTGKSGFLPGDDDGDHEELRQMADMIDRMRAAR